MSKSGAGEQARHFFLGQPTGLALLLDCLSLGLLLTSLSTIGVLLFPGSFASVVSLICFSS
jgi:hypothetical protein